MADCPQSRQSPCKKNDEVCFENGGISKSEESCCGCDDEGSNSSKKCEQHIAGGCSSNSSQAADEEFSCSPQTNSLLGSYITKEYELLHLVLSHLPLGDLNAASQVCRTWNTAAASVRRSRIHPHWLLWRSGQRQQLPEQPYQLKSLKFAEAMASVPYVAFREHVYSEPSLALMFASNTVFGAKVLCTYKCSCPALTQTHSDEKDGHQHRVWEYVKAELQPSCPLLCLRGYGVVGTLPDLTETVELENSRAYSVLLLPEMPGVTIRTFQFDVNKITKLQKIKTLSADTIEQLTGIPPNESVQCLLLFCREAVLLISSIVHLVTGLQNRQEETMAVAGGMISDVGGSNEGVPVMVGVAFSGEGVSVASTILGRNVKSEREADKAIQELKAHTVGNYYSSVGLMFACVGRGRHHYQGKRNVESAAFRRHFPKTPLLGYFGNGEIGFKLLPDVTVNKRLVDGPTRGSKKKRTDLPNILHSYTTIMVHLAFTGSNTNNQNHR
ncbi:F-box only protein 22-like [Periplaneta americana]|uniref:F-box only protein 22-like n=1 Tax=Periplaneta americana TaxID=6978 RepID=UPI0037E757F8